MDEKYEALNCSPAFTRCSRNVHPDFRDSCELTESLLCSVVAIIASLECMQRPMSYFSCHQMLIVVMALTRNVH